MELNVSRILRKEALKKHYLLKSCLWLFCLHVCLWAIYMYGAYKSHKRPMDPLELQLQVTMWVLDIKPMSSGGAISALDCWAIAATPESSIFFPLKNDVISSVFEILHRTNTYQKRQFLSCKRQQLHWQNALVISQRLPVCIGVGLRKGNQMSSSGSLTESLDFNSLLVSLQLLVSGLSINLSAP